MSTILATLFLPDATTRMSTRPNRFDRRLDDRVAVGLVEFGRLAIASTSAPSVAHSAATFFSAFGVAGGEHELAPAPASTFAASAPNAPDAPVTIAVLPRTSNSDSGFFQEVCSDIDRAIAHFGG